MLKNLYAQIALNALFCYTPNKGNQLLGKLRDSGRQPADFFALSPSGKKELLPELDRDNKEKILRADEKNLLLAKEEFERLAADGIQLVTPEQYPDRLRRCPDAPLLLYMKSCSKAAKVLNVPMTAVVGTRDPSTYGLATTDIIIRTLNGKGAGCIVSGLAVGIDIRAHRSALNLGMPTVAVLPTGIDQIYPFMHRAYADTITRTPGCALVTSFPPGTEPLAVNMLLRNHIIAGLSERTIVVESKTRGGALVTARLARDYGRQVLAVPGRIEDVRSQGCNTLIQEGTAQILPDTESL